MQQEPRGVAGNGSMSDQEVMASVAKQLMQGKTVALQGQRLPVRRSSSQRLKMVRFKMRGSEYDAIEQNPEKPSRWGQLARAGHEVVQFKDVQSNRFIAVSVDGKVKQYSNLRRRSSEK